MLAAAAVSKKRKHPGSAEHKKKKKKKKKPLPSAPPQNAAVHATPKPAAATTAAAATTTTTAEAASSEQVVRLEEAIVASPKNYNNIVTLLELIRAREDVELAVTAAVALCRTFCRLMGSGRMSKQNGTDAEIKVAGWLKERYNEYVGELCKAARDSEAGDLRLAALPLCLRLVKEEAAYLRPAGNDCYFPQDTFGKLVTAMANADDLDENITDDLAEKINQYEDLRYSFFIAVTHLCRNPPENIVRNLLPVLLAIKNMPTAESAPPSEFYALSPPKKAKATILQLSAHRKAAQECWLAILRRPLSTEQCKQILDCIAPRVVPSFTKPQLLMDFLTECYDAGGSLSLLALSGLFHLIATQNLDYPDFYPKLYALLTGSLLHSRFRSRFLRLLQTFLASTHLPGALVASFIKRLARRALFAPPAAIVAVVPFIYNLLQMHPSCTFMIHREGSLEDHERWRKEGFADPYDDTESDPMKTGAIGSCLWEIETLQSHWNPNVATLCRIISEPFTKDRYNVEDFLDHSYDTMFNDAMKPYKKTPVVEYYVPKKVFFPLPKEDEDEDGEVPLIGKNSSPLNVLLKYWDLEQR